jgi:CcmD family protein
MELRNLTFMFYGFLAAWLIVFAYVIGLVRRNARLKKELEDIRNLVSSAQGNEALRLQDKVR